MKHTICFIDDKIPVSQYPDYFKDTDIINESVLNFLLKTEGTNWSDIVVKNMCERLINDSDNWSISAFTSPNFYNNYVNETVYAPEIIIYDWDYNTGAGSNESEDCLLEILKTSYTMIFVFSEQDNINEINSVLDDVKFNNFKERLSVIDKSTPNSINLIFEQIGQKEDNNFSFRYGHEIIYNSNKTINKILSDISQLSIEDFISSINSQFDGHKYIASNDAFVDVILPRFNNVLRSYNPIQKIEVIKTKEPNLNSVKDIWSYRMYDRTPSGLVQMGDIIKNEENNNFYLVISSDCHMGEFWKKNLGYVALIPLLKLKDIQTKELLNISGKLVSFNLSSLTSNNQSPMTVLPCVPIGEELLDFVVVPKRICSVSVVKKDSPALLYEHFDNYKKVVSVSDPFKSPLIQYVCSIISGYGCPDFHKLLKENLENNIKELKL